MLVEPGNHQPFAQMIESSLFIDLDVGSNVKLNLNFKITTRDIARDSDGKPLMPIVAKGATIHNLGVIVHDRPSYHSKNYIWPVGYRSTRKLPRYCYRITLFLQAYLYLAA
jgi:hypothetical protein